MPPNDLYELPIAARPAHRTPLANRLLVFPVFFAGVFVIIGIQAVFVPVGIASQLSRRLRRGGDERDGWLGSVYEWGVKRTKQMFGMLLILLTVLFAPTSITLTSDATLPLETILRRPSAPGGLTYLALPTDLVIMSNHQAYLDWIFIWILGYLSVAPDSTSPSNESEDKALRKRKSIGAHHGSQSLVILLKRSLKWVPIIGWGMQFYRFIFLARSWALDRQNLTTALRHLALHARRGSGLWVLIFPEGTITSDHERAKSVRYAQREGVPDFVNVLHPRSTGLHFILRSLVPQIKTLKLLDITIGYPGVTRGAYAQDWYGLGSVFIKGIAPPSVHIHLRLVDLQGVDVPGVTGAETTRKNEDREEPLAVSDTTPLLDQAQTERITAGPRDPVSIPGLATETEAREFNMWLRSRWGDKEVLLDRFTRTGGFAVPPKEDEGRLVDEVERRELVDGKAEVLRIGLW